MQESFDKQVSAATIEELHQGAIDIEIFLSEILGLNEDGFMTDETLARDIQQYYLGEGSASPLF